MLIKTGGYGGKVYAVCKIPRFPQLLCTCCKLKAKRVWNIITTIEREVVLS